MSVAKPWVDRERSLPAGFTVCIDRGHTLPMDSSKLSRPRVPLFDRLVGAFAARWPRFMQRLGDWETSAVHDEIAEQRIVRPVYVCGLARAGSTVLLELLAAAPEFTTHRYSDYPLLWTPYWWNWLCARLPLPSAQPQQRAHHDRIAVTVDSPEAFEEVLWMHFFAGRHDPGVDQILSAQSENATFATFYTMHLRKLLVIRGARRYLAKGNYNLTRIAYLRRLFPDARFIIAVREPLAHVASLVKQDRLFNAWAKDDPTIARHLARCGHFEFGPHKSAVNVGDAEHARAIQACFDTNQSAQAYARQWAASYGWLMRTLANDAQLARACRLVDYGQLCAEPQAELEKIYAHAGVEVSLAARLSEEHATRLALPDYYQPEFSASESDLIEQETTEVWRQVCAWIKGLKQD